LGLIEAGFNIANAAFDFTQKIVSLFPVTCSRTGYKRGNRINILNALKQEIQLTGRYEDSGKIYEEGHQLGVCEALRVSHWLKRSGCLQPPSKEFGDLLREPLVRLELRWNLH
jgi:hypothetical protein